MTGELGWHRRTARDEVVPGPPDDDVEPQPTASPRPLPLGFALPLGFLVLCLLGAAAVLG